MTATTTHRFPHAGERFTIEIAGDNAIIFNDSNMRGVQARWDGGKLVALPDSWFGMAPDRWLIDEATRALGGDPHPDRLEPIEAFEAFATDAAAEARAADLIAQGSIVAVFPAKPEAGIDAGVALVDSGIEPHPYVHRIAHVRRALDVGDFYQAGQRLADELPDEAEGIESWPQLLKAAPGFARWTDPVTQAEILRGVADSVNEEWNP